MANNDVADIQATLQNLVLQQHLNRFRNEHPLKVQRIWHEAKRTEEKSRQDCT
jgi:hypothetical protein